MITIKEEIKIQTRNNLWMSTDQQTNSISLQIHWLLKIKKELILDQKEMRERN